MTEQLSIVCLYLICIFTGLVGGIATFFYNSDDENNISIIRLIGVSFLAFTISITFGEALFKLDVKSIIIISYLIFTINILIFYQKKISAKGLLGLTIIFVFVVMAIPFNTYNIILNLDQNRFFNIINLISIIPITFSIIILRKFKKSDLQSKYKNIITILLIGILSTTIVPANYASVITILIIFFPTIFIISLMKIETDQTADKMKKKLTTLESEFNYELRKELNKRTFHLKEVQEKMSHINKIDNLTGTYNKKAIFNIIDDLIISNKVQSFSLIMFDLDNFKRLNDTFGHVQGDLCLKTLASIGFESVRDSDYFGRYGGDEFLIVLPDSNLQTAITISERFRRSVQTKTKPPFTVSVGLATYPADGDSLKELLDIADKGLYYSKEKGRNSVSYHNPNLDKKF